MDLQPAKQEKQNDALEIGLSTDTQLQLNTVLTSVYHIFPPRYEIYIQLKLKWAGSSTGSSPRRQSGGRWPEKWRNALKHDSNNGLSHNDIWSCIYLKNTAVCLTEKAAVALSSYLGDAVETAHERVQRVEQTQDVVQGSCQSWIVVYEGQLNHRGWHDAHLRYKQFIYF